MRSLTGPSRRSPSIRSPSLLQTSFAPSTSPSRSLTRNPLPKKIIRIIQGLIVLLVGWYEYGTFYFSAQRGWNCFIQQTSSPTSSSSRSTPATSETLKVLVVTDPQLLDMERSYEGRNRGLKWLSIKITNQFMKKSWRFLSRTSGKRAIDAVVWNGDLLDNGREMEIDDSNDEYSSYTRLFHQLFPLPRQHSKALSASSHSSHQLDPPVPVIYVPGNHDLPLHSSTSSNSTQQSISVKARDKFKESFGPLWGEREMGGWNLIWIDSIALIEQGFWNDKLEGSSEFRKMKDWLEGLGKGPVTVPRILFTHIPLFRPPSTSCGTHRESRNFNGGIRDGYGKGYQNLIGKVESDWLMERVRPEKVFSGDDHDYCFVTHNYTSPIDQSQKVTETTVKSFSMAMGVSHPGYSFLTLHPPSSTSSDLAATTTTSPSTFTEHSCTLPSQLGIYLHVYLPLSISLFIFFLSPKLKRVWKSFLKRRRKNSRRKLGGASNSRRRGFGRRGTTGEKAGVGGGQEEEDGESLFSTINSPDSSFTAGSEYGYSAALAGDDGSEPISNRPSPLRREYGEDDEEADEEDSSTEEEDEVESRDARRSRRPSKVRRVSKVWLWEKDSSASSLLSTPRLSSAGVLPRYSSPSIGGYDDEPPSQPILSRLKDLAHRLLNRLSQNTLLLPLLRLLRPVLRLLRTLLFILLGKPLEWITRMLGGEKGVGRAINEAGKEFWEVAWGGIAVWVVVWVWIGM